jgi:hypothetical protein
MPVSTKVYFAGKYCLEKISIENSVGFTYWYPKPGRYRYMYKPDPRMLFCGTIMYLLYSWLEWEKAKCGQAAEEPRR